MSSIRRSSRARAGDKGTGHPDRRNQEGGNGENSGDEARFGKRIKRLAVHIGGSVVTRLGRALRLGRQSDDTGSINRQHSVTR